jgi:hypothetical protein
MTSDNIEAVPLFKIEQILISLIIGSSEGGFAGRENVTNE